MLYIPLSSIIKKRMFFIIKFNYDICYESSVVRPHQFIRRLSQDLGISKTTVYIILKAEKIHPYRLQHHQQLYKNDITRKF